MEQNLFLPNIIRRAPNNLFKKISKLNNKMTSVQVENLKLTTQLAQYEGVQAKASLYEEKLTSAELENKELTDKLTKANEKIELMGKKIDQLKMRAKNMSKRHKSGKQKELLKLQQQHDAEVKIIKNIIWCVNDDCVKKGRLREDSYGKLTFLKLVFTAVNKLSTVPSHVIKITGRTTSINAIVLKSSMSQFEQDDKYIK